VDEAQDRGQRVATILPLLVRHRSCQVKPVLHWSRTAHKSNQTAADFILASALRPRRTIDAVHNSLHTPPTPP